MKRPRDTFGGRWRAGEMENNVPTDCGLINPQVAAYLVGSISNALPAR